VYRRCGGAMVRTLNLRSTLTKIAGELTRRFRGSAMADWRGELLIADPREKVTLRIERGTVRVSDGGSARHALRGGEEIAQLLIGTDDPRQVIAAGGIRATGDALRLAEALFPAQHPQLCLWDRY
jgi:predicted acetyltransferase